jgi:alpha-L-rhamnosidase
MNIQGANVFGVDIGVGSDKTYDNIIKYYKKLGHYDTGIFGTDILTRLLFERGDSDLAVDLLTNDGEHGFEHWRKNGATTFHEYWDSSRSRSHNHPMFGAPVAYLFEYLLGIRQPKNTAGYKDVVIEPLSTDRFKFMQGHITTPNGKLAVKYQRQDGKLQFNILIPKGTKAIFKHLDKQFDLVDGENIFDISI